MERVARNAPCPCGSGKKFKSCCGTGEKTRSGQSQGRILGLGVAVVVVVGALIVLNHFRTADLSADAASPEPWEYDAARNQHYNPLPGHEHWHDGPPPQNADGTLNTATVPIPIQQQVPVTQPVAPLEPATQPTTAPDDGSPQPWDYDEVNDRHWNPGTQAWDTGMPPLEAFTSGGN